MSSYRRIQSSRANGARSRGPVTPEGRQASARNGLRHGMLANTIVLTGESDDRFKALLAAFVDEYHPVTESETALVESMAVARWRQMRVWGIEKSGLDREMARHEGPAPLRAAIAFRNLSEGRTLDLIHRYESGYERQFSHALKQLELRQSRRGPDDEPYIPPTLASATWDLPDEPNPSSEHPDDNADQRDEIPSSTENPPFRDCSGADTRHEQISGNPYRPANSLNCGGDTVRNSAVGERHVNCSLGSLVGIIRQRKT